MGTALNRKRSVSRKERGTTRQRSSIRRDVPTVVSPITGGALTDHDVAERFSARIVGYTPAQLAKAARCTKEGAKHWVDGSRCPSLPKILEMARTMPAVKEWLASEVGGFESTETISQLLRALDQRLKS